jgi:hypothetical protein
VEKRNSIHEKESDVFLLWRAIPLTHVPFSVVTSYRLNEQEVGVRVSREAKVNFLLLHVYAGRWVQRCFRPVNAIVFNLF